MWSYSPCPQSRKWTSFPYHTNSRIQILRPHSSAIFQTTGSCPSGEFETLIDEELLSPVFDAAQELYNYNWHSQDYDPKWTSHWRWSMAAWSIWCHYLRSWSLFQHCIFYPLWICIDIYGFCRVHGRVWTAGVRGFAGWLTFVARRGFVGLIAVFGRCRQIYCRMHLCDVSVCYQWSLSE